MIVVPAATGAGAQSAAAAVTTLYVNQVSAGCSDSGPGTQAVPFCSIQAAADVVNPGQTVDIASSDYQPVTITRSGTPSAPITFTGTWPLGGTAPRVIGSTPVVTLQDVHDVTISSLTVYNSGTADGIDVVGSQGITLDSLSIVNQNNTTVGSTAGVSIDG